MKNGAEIIAMFFVAFAMASTATGMIFTVDDDGPADFNNIQAAINNANHGDTIVVADGIYRGEGNRNISLRRKAITLRSENGWSNCIIDCEGQDHGFYFYNNENENSIVDGFTIINGNAYYGGGIYCYGSNPTITNCRMNGNEAIWGGGIFCRNNSSPTISNCIISENVAHSGGGISCSNSSSPLINNCLITGNTGTSGGGIHSYKYSCPMINNCTITENEVTHYGGGICSNNYSSPTINNCILWGNRAFRGDEIVLIDQTYPSQTTVRYSDVQGGSTAVYISPGCVLNWGQGNIDADPMFIDIDGLDDVLGTEDDNLRLFGCSPCVDAGDNSAVPPSLLTDIEGNPRIINGNVDIGAYEGANQGFLLSTKSLTVSEGAVATFTVILAMDPFETIEVTVAVESGDPDIMIESGALLTFNSSNYLLPQAVVLVAAEDADNLNGTALVWISAPGFVTNGISATEVDNDEPTSNILYVDASSPGVNNGASWSEAYTELRDAMSIAARFPQVEEIRVGQGTYTPAESSGDRTATFQLKNGVVIKGGYAGFSEPDPNARDIESYETILSGDLEGNDIDLNDPEDLLYEPTRAENSYHVVTTSDTNETAVLDGFTITAGNANRRRPLEHYQDDGGGIYNYEGSPTITNCVISSNSARDNGGGMYNHGDESSPTIINCKFISNSARAGGGIYNYRNDTRIENCKFTFNWASEAGGGISNGQSIGRLTNCTFIGNRAPLGGGMSNGDCNILLNNCTFNENFSTYGGAVFNVVCSPTFINCRFKGNSALSKGGGMVNASSSPVLKNCTFCNNSSENGGGMCNYMDRGPAGFDTSNPVLNNCLYSNNSAKYGGGMCNSDKSHPTLTNCTFSGNWAKQYGGAICCRDIPPPQPPPPPPIPLLEFPQLTTDSLTPDVNLIMVNCILWCNEAPNGTQIYLAPDYYAWVNYSNVQGSWPGEGNIDAVPLFVEPGYWYVNGTPDDVNDDVWVEGDYHLLPGSPCIDAGDPIYVAEPNETDLDGRPRVINGRIDMGAYESVPPIPAQVRIVPRTINIKNKGNWIIAFIWLPENHNVADIDSKSILLNSKIQAESVHTNEEEQVALARFSHQEVQLILNVGEVELSIIFCLTDGRVFEGRDVVRVIPKASGKPDKHVQAGNPNPSDGAKGVSITANLSWTAGPYVTSHDVYFGTSSTPPFVCNQISTTFDPGTMKYDTMYYWRIDEVNYSSTTTGEIWKFTTFISPPIPPPPP